MTSGWLGWLSMLIVSLWAMPVAAQALDKQPCVLVATDHAPPLAPRFDCTTAAKTATGEVTWALFDGLNLRNDAQQQLQFRMSNHQMSDEAVFVRFADGGFAKSPTNMMAARQSYSSGTLSYLLPQDRRSITAIYVRAVNQQNQRGAAPNPAIFTAAAGQSDNVKFLLVYGTMAGAALALLLLNASLFFVLRYRFLLAYCGGLAMVLAFGLSWSGGIFYLFPSITPRTQVSISMVAMGGYALAQALLMITALEKEKRSQAASRIALWLGVAAIVMPLVRLCFPDFAWSLVDQLCYLGLAATFIAILANSVLAQRAGSAIATYYIIVWSVPFVLGFARTLWAVGLINGGGAALEGSPLFMIFVEAVLGAVAVGRQVGRLRDERDTARQLESHLRNLSESDPLTGLLNRRAFIEKACAGQHVKRLIVLDIDHFKAINDGFGHDVGDQVICAVARALQQTAPPGTLIGRIGGEEFAVIETATPSSDLAEKLRHAVETASFQEGPLVTVSAGVSEGNVTDEKGWRILYIAADEALYTAKRAGRNQVSCALRRHATKLAA